MATSTPAEHLAPSELGTKEYWDKTYALELTNHATNPTDEGTVWFSDADAEDKVLSYLESLDDEGVLDKRDTSFLDLGTGNGHMLFALRDAGWEGRMVGVDYSGASVRLARQVQEKRVRDSRDDEGEESGGDAVLFEEWDILNFEAGEWLGDGFDVVLDKGTFDAISLSGEMGVEGRRICEGYRERVEKLVKKGGRLLVTSCNWTEAELRWWFDVSGGGLTFEDSIKYPSFRFGGVEGTKVASVCFRRKDEDDP
ncbi:Protein-lysine N-methyltransferase efm4 [Coniosporium apollinis]|uniref:Protein-lysine N-methyltransferase EFM4 n=1 Tax=Coniosporium apollinis TaxID=61459 RepID=A0ABQ9P0L7_9PEZI|nr:Protein-lysine N-methyltransferase efm4 [Coniosporium apollinis]